MSNTWVNIGVYGSENINNNNNGNYKYNNDHDWSWISSSSSSNYGDLKLRSESIYLVFCGIFLFFAGMFFIGLFAACYPLANYEAAVMAHVEAQLNAMWIIIVAFIINFIPFADWELRLINICLLNGTYWHPITYMLCAFTGGKYTLLKKATQKQDFKVSTFWDTVCTLILNIFVVGGMGLHCIILLYGTYRVM